jgi:hypothetical protein
MSMSTLDSHSRAAIAPVLEACCMSSYQRFCSSVEQQPRLLRLFGATPVATACEGPMEHEMGHALRVPGGVLDRGRAAARKTEQREALEPRRVDHGGQIGDVRVERRQALELAVREPAPAHVVADERAPAAEFPDPVPQTGLCRS